MERTKQLRRVADGRVYILRKSRPCAALFKGNNAQEVKEKEVSI